MWSRLESERDDCQFIYLTHNLDFAASRVHAAKIWCKSYTYPDNWDIEMLPNDNTIPERLLMEILGSRENIIFCEGDDKSSHDYKLYSIFFKNFIIIPVGGHKNVINYTRAYNKNRELYGKTNAYPESLCSPFGLAQTQAPSAL